MPLITEGCTYDTVAREWRCKWTDLECLASVQRVLDSYKERVKGVAGVKSVQVCGRCGWAVGAPRSLCRSASYLPDVPRLQGHHGCGLHQAARMGGGKVRARGVESAKVDASH